MEKVTKDCYKHKRDHTYKWYIWKSNQTKTLCQSDMLCNKFIYFIEIIVAGK